MRIEAQQHFWPPHFGKPGF